MYSDITNTVAVVSLLTAQVISTAFPPQLVNHEQILSVKEISLDKRYAVPAVNKVFKDNILLNIAYLKGAVQDPQKINWQEVQKPFNYEFKLASNQTFAFHNDVLPEYDGKVTKTTNAHFNAAEGFKTDGYLFGDGVCHLASLIYWTARDAGLDTKAPTSHDFMAIPEIPKEYGVSIYNNPGTKDSNALQNLYIKNNKGKELTFKFEYQNNDLKVLITEAI